jgi:hypothetical protein
MSSAHFCEPFLFLLCFVFKKAEKKKTQRKKKKKIPWWKENPEA